MSSRRVGRALAVVYLLAVVASTLIWLIQGAYSTGVWVTMMALTLPWSPLGYVLLAAVGVLLLGSNAAVQSAVSWALVLLVFPGMAVGNVLMARALWRTRRRRELHRESARSG